MPVPSAVSTGAVQTSVGRLDASELFPDGDIAVDPMESDLVSNMFSYAIYRPGYIQLTAVPDAEARKYPLKAILVLTLSRSCLECDCGDWAVEEWMWDMYFQDWLDGTLARLYGMPSKPWTDPTICRLPRETFPQFHGVQKAGGTERVYLGPADVAVSTGMVNEWYLRSGALSAAYEAVRLAHHAACSVGLGWHADVRSN